MQTNKFGAHLKPAFAIAAMLLCAHTGIASTPKGADLIPPGPAYFAGKGHVPHGKEVLFMPWNKLPEDDRRIFNNSEISINVKNGKICKNGGKPDCEEFSGRALYESDKFDSQFRAMLLNLFVKMDATKLADGTTVLNHVESFNVLHKDRFFGTTDDTLLEEVRASSTPHKNSPNPENTDVSTGDAIIGVIKKAFYHRGPKDSCLHHADPGYIKDGSYKTFDRHGNLDITLTERDPKDIPPPVAKAAEIPSIDSSLETPARDSEGAMFSRISGLSEAAASLFPAMAVNAASRSTQESNLAPRKIEADEDEENRGIRHLARVVWHMISRSKTGPYRMSGRLVKYQNLTPPYEIIQKGPETASAGTDPVPKGPKRQPLLQNSFH